jgi:hypothetical protein
MKTTIRRFRIGIGLMGLILVTSCSKPAPPIGNTFIGINMVYHGFPSVTNSVYDYSGVKIPQYFLSLSTKKFGEVGTIKKVGKANNKIKARPISLGGFREAPLI